MNKEQAIEILVKVAHLAQEKGLLTLADASVVAAAVAAVTPSETTEEVAQVEELSTEEKTNQ